MQSGCPHNQGGTYPAFQHQSNVATLTANTDNNGRPKPLAHPANVEQNIMVAIPYSTEHRVAYNPGQWQQGSTQAPQNFLELHHQQVSSIENSGFQPPVPRDSTFSFQNRHCQKSRTVNDDFHSSAHVSAQHSSYFGTSAHENSVRQSIYNNGQQKEGSNVKKTSGLQQSNCASSVSTSSAGLQGVGVGVGAKAFPSPQRSFPLLKALLKGNSFDLESCFTTSSKKTNSNIEPDTSAHLSDERHYKSQHSGSSPPALHCGQTRTQIPNQLGGTHQQVCSPSLSGQPSIGKVSPDVEMEPIRHDHISDFIDERMEYYRTHPDKGGGVCTNDKDFIHQYDSTLPLTVSDFEDVEKQSHKCHMVEQYTAAVGQELQEDSSKGSKAWVELTSKSKEMGDCTTSASENHSTGTLPFIIENLKHAPKSATVGCDFILKKHLDVAVTAYGDGKLVYSDDCCEDTLVRSNDETFHSKWWCDQSLQNVTTLHYTLTALKELIASLEKVETNAEMDNFSKSILQQYWNGDIDNIHLFTSTEYRQIMKTVAATCTKSEDKSPVILTSVSEWHPSLMANCSLSQKECVWLNNKNLEAIDQEPGISGTSKHITAEERGLKPVEEAAALDGVQVVTDIPEDLPPESGSVVSENKTFEVTPIENHYANTNKQKNIEDQQHGHVMCEEVRALSKLNSLIDEIPNVVSFPTYRREQICEGAREEAGSVSSQKGLSNILSENKVKEGTPLSKSGGEVFSFKILKDPQYEDISDDDVSQLSTELPQTKHEELRFPTCFEDPQYEEVSEEEDSQIENPSLAQVPTPDNRQSHLARQTTHSVSYSPSSVLKYEDQTEDQMDDDWIVIPISMLDLKFGLEDEDQGGPEDVLDDGENGDNERQSGTSPMYHASHWPSSQPVPASAFSQLEVFDTIESFRQAVHFKKCLEVAPGSSTPEHEMDSEKDPHTPQKRGESEPEDSCETEDSCDYSSASEHNYLTVHRQLLKRSAPLPPERCYPVSDIESDSDVVTNVQNGQTSSSDKLDHMQKLLTKAKAGSKHVKPKTKKQKFSEKEDVIIINSDTEDEVDLNCNKTAKRKKILFSGLVDSGDTLRGQQKRHSPDTQDSPCGTDKEQVQRNRPSSADSPAPQHQSQFKDLMEDACPEQSHSTKSRQLIANNAGSEHVQYNVNRQMSSEMQSVIILASDTEDESGHNYKKSKRKRLDLPASAHSVQQKGQLLETVDTRCGAADEKLQEPRLSPADLSVPQQQTKANDTRVRHMMKDTCSDSSHSVRNSRHLIEQQPEFKHIQHKTIGQKTSKKERTVFHGFEKEVNSDHISMSVDMEVDCSLIPNPGILHLVQKSQPNVRLKRIKESRIHEEDKDETRVPKTSTATRKKSVSCDTSRSDLCRNKKGQFMSKTKLGNERQHETKNRSQQTDVMKHKLVSRQLSFPSQECPSTSTSSLSSTHGQLCEGRSSSASSRVLSQFGAISAPSAPRKSKSPPIPRHLSSSKLRQSHSYDNTSTSDHTCIPKGLSSSANTQLSARKQVIKDWHNSYFPTRRDRKPSLCMEEDLRSTNNNFQREARPGPSHYDRAPRQRHKSQDPPTALMKKSMCEAKQWTNHIHRETPKEPRSVGEGYKWSEKPLVTPTKGSARKQQCRSSQRPHQ
ncbi:hypothetical protein PAMP_014751 [Pampus punctatissimus]